YRNVPLADIQDRLDKLHPVAMRLEMKEAINGCYLIDDTYNNDLAGLAIALDFQANQPKRGSRTLILSDLLESGLSEAALYSQVALLLQNHDIDKLIGIGQTISHHKLKFSCEAVFYNST